MFVFIWILRGKIEVGKAGRVSACEASRYNSHSAPDSLSRCSPVMLHFGSLLCFFSWGQSELSSFLCYYLWDYSLSTSETGLNPFLTLPTMSRTSMQCGKLNQKLRKHVSQGGPRASHVTTRYIPQSVLLYFSEAQKLQKQEARRPPPMQG